VPRQGWGGVLQMAHCCFRVVMNRCEERPAHLWQIFFISRTRNENVDLQNTEKAIRNYQTQRSGLTVPSRTPLASGLTTALIAPANRRSNNSR